MAVEPIIKARTQLLLSQPFFGALALRLKMEPNDTIKTLDVDGKTMRYNPEFVASLPMNVLISAVAHEVCHCMLMHHLRRNHREPEKWNIACDFAVNNILKAAGFTLGDSWYQSDEIGEASADHVYTMLPDMPGISAYDQASAPGDVLDGVDPSNEAEVRREEAEWKVAISQSANAAKMMGKLPANLQRLVGELVDSKVCWKSILREFVKATSADDYTWSRPNRRFIGQGMYFPSLYNESIGEIVVAVDTSGSVTADEMNQFASEITAIMEDVSPSTVHVVYCDTQIAHTESFTKDDMPLQLNAKGGGGTDFRPPFEWVEEQGIDPACFIYLTDMCCRSFPEPPAYPTLWIDTSGHSTAPFGQVVEMTL